jgi:hypothetical protein
LQAFPPSVEELCLNSEGEVAWPRSSVRWQTVASHGGFSYERKQDAGLADLEENSSFDNRSDLYDDLLLNESLITVLGPLLPLTDSKHQNCDPGNNEHRRDQEGHQLPGAVGPRVPYQLG